MYKEKFKVAKAGGWKKMHECGNWGRIKTRFQSRLEINVFK